MVWTNFHSHCNFCDGSDPTEAYIEEAIRRGMAVYGFSSHAPLPVQRDWAMRKDELPRYIQQLQTLRSRYQHEIELAIGLEIDYLPGVSWWDFYGTVLRGLDYTIGSVHLVEAFPDGRPWEVDGDHATFAEGLACIFKGDIRAAVSRYFELTRWMLMLENPDILGHFDKIKLQNIHGDYFQENEPWYQKEVEKTLKVVATMGTIVEVNTRGLYSGKTLDFYPSHWILERMAALRIPITLNSDAHRPVELTAGFEHAAALLRKIGFKELMVLESGHWKPVCFDENGLHHAWLLRSKSQNRPA
jgi:histidinol-phosphatase (PHP family)